MARRARYVGMVLALLACWGVGGAVGWFLGVALVGAGVGYWAATD